MDKNASIVLTKGEFKRTLYRKFHFTDVDKFEAVYEKYELDNFFNFLDKMQPKLTVDEFNRIVLAAREKVFFSKEDNDFRPASISEFTEEVKSIVEKSDLNLYEEIARINDKFCVYFNKNNIKMWELGKTKRRLWKQALEFNTKVNDIIYSTSKPVQAFDLYASLYSVLIKHIGHIGSINGQSDKAYRRIVDKLLVEKIANKKKMIESLLDDNLNQVEVFDKFLREISNSEYGDAAFGSEEIFKLLCSTPSLVSNAAADKWNQVYAALEKHIDKIAEKESANVKEENRIKKLVNRKTLLKQCGTIVVANPSTISFVSDLLTGKGISEAVANNIDVFSRSDKEEFMKKAFVKGIFGELKISGMNYKTNKYILTSSLSLFKNLSSNAIYNSLDGLCFCLCKAYNITPTNLAENVLKLKEKGINPAKFYTKDNIFDLFPYKILSETKKIRSDSLEDSDDTLSDEGKNLTANFELLSKFVPGNDLMKVIQHNTGLLKLKNEKLKAEIANVLNTSGTMKEFCENFENFINSKYKKVNFTTGKGSKDSGKKFISGKDKPETIEIDEFIFDEKTLKELFGLDNNKIKEFIKPREVVVKEFEGGVKVNPDKDPSRKIFIIPVDTNKLEDLEFLKDLATKIKDGEVDSDKPSDSNENPDKADEDTAEKNEIATFCDDFNNLINKKLAAINTTKNKSNNGLVTNGLYVYKRNAKKLNSVISEINLDNDAEKWTVIGFLNGLKDNLNKKLAEIDERLAEQLSIVKDYEERKKNFNAKTQGLIKSKRADFDFANSILTEMGYNSNKFDAKKILYNFIDRDSFGEISTIDPDKQQDIFKGIYKSDGNLTRMKNEAMQRYSDYAELRNGIEIMLNSINSVLDSANKSPVAPQKEKRENSAEHINALKAEYERCETGMNANIKKLRGKFTGLKVKINIEDIKINGQDSRDLMKLTKRRPDERRINILADDIMEKNKRMMEILQELKELGAVDVNDSKANERIV